MSVTEALIVAIIQGATELFPVSSLGHAILIPSLLHMTPLHELQGFLPYLVMLHLGTTVALLLFFWKDWYTILTSIISTHNNEKTEQGRNILLLLIIATIPAVIIGSLAEHLLKTIFSIPSRVAVFIIINGFILIIAEKKRYSSHKPRENLLIETLTWKDALIIGLCQCAAFLPGISRAGSAMSGGLLRGLNHENAAKFSFLMGLPIILAATVHQGYQLAHQSIAREILTLGAIGAITAGITAYICMTILMKYFHNHDKWALTPFAVYCMFLGIATLFFYDS